MPEDKKTPEELAKEQAERLTKLESSLTSLSENMTKFMTGLENLGERIESLKPIDDDKESKKPDHDVSLETLDRAGFLQVILDKVGEMLENKLEPVKKGVEETEEKLTKTELSRQLKKAEKSHPDFWEWKEEMGEIARRSPGLSIEEVYQLARYQNPDKAKELDEKFKSDDEREREKAEKEKASKGSSTEVFGGLFPTSGKTAEKTDMTLDEAAEKAFDKVFGTGAEAGE